METALYFIGYIILGLFINMFLTSDSYTKGTGEVETSTKEEKSTTRLVFWIVWIGLPILFVL